MSTASQLRDQLDNGCDLELIESLARDLITEHKRAIKALKVCAKYLSDPYVQEWHNRSGYKTDGYGRALLAAVETLKKAGAK